MAALSCAQTVTAGCCGSFSCAPRRTVSEAYLPQVDVVCRCAPGAACRLHCAHGQGVRRARAEERVDEVGREVHRFQSKTTWMTFCPTPVLGPGDPLSKCFFLARTVLLSLLLSLLLKCCVLVAVLHAHDFAPSGADVGHMRCAVAPHVRAVVSGRAHDSTWRLS